MEKLKVERTIWIEAPRQRVWSAITDPVQLSIWFAPGSKWEIPALKIGGIVKFYNTETDIAVRTIVLREENRQKRIDETSKGYGMSLENLKNHVEANLD